MSGTKVGPGVMPEGPRRPRKTDPAVALDEHRRLVGPRAYCYGSRLISPCRPPA